MATISAAYPRAGTSGGGFGRFLALLIILSVLTGTVVFMFSHGVDKHGTDAERVRRCMNKNGPLMIWQKSGERFIKVCEIEPGVFGIQILDRVGDELREKTAFIKEKFNQIEQVIKYLENGGAKQIWP